MAKKLANIYGEDENKAYVAGILHDVTKEFDNSQHIKLIEEHNYKLSETQKVSTKIWHSKTGAIYAKEVLGINDKQILNAIKYHTTGRKNMCMLEKIIYIADLVSEDRSYNGVDTLRKIAGKDINEALIEALSFSIQSLAIKKMLIDNNTFEAYQELIYNKIKNNEGRV